MITETIEFKGVKLDIEFEVEKYYPATYYTPEEGGNIEIYDIFHNGESIFDIVSCVKDYEDIIIDELIKKL